jgi:hypothetical protein
MKSLLGVHFRELPMFMQGFCSILPHFLAAESVPKEIKPLQAKAITLYSAEPNYSYRARNRKVE